MRDYRNIAAAKISASGARGGDILQRKCACGGTPGPTGECAECRRKRMLGIEPKLRINRRGDRFEREADRVASRVTGAPTPARRAETSVASRPIVQRQGSTRGDLPAPPVVNDALRSEGRPIDAALRRSMESRLGHDFGDVRIHTGALADRSADAVNARAYTVGRDIVFARNEYAPKTHVGERLLAHELVHVVQQRSGGAGPNTVYRFERGQRNQIGELDELVSTAARVAHETCGFGYMRWGRFTAAMGGSGGWEALTSPESGSTAEDPFPRYLYTCRCGLLDMRHFYQIMYIAVARGEEAAVNMGVQHEELGPPASRYAPEDITSNALGADFGDARTWVEEQSSFVSALRAYLSQCDPVAWHGSGLTDSDRDCVVNFYAVDADGASHLRETIGSDADPCNLCEQRASFPFKTDERGTMIVE